MLARNNSIAFLTAENAENAEKTLPVMPSWCFLTRDTFIFNQIELTPPPACLAALPKKRFKMSSLSFGRQFVFD